MGMRRFLVVVSLSLASAASACEADPPQDPTVPRPKSGDWLARHEALNARVRQGHVDLIFLGDSITAGWENEGKDVWDTHFAPLHAVNLGIGGDRTQNVLWRLDNGNIAGIRPKLAVVMIGTNNSDRNTPEEIAAGVTAIVRKLRQKLLTTRVLLLGIFPRGANNDDPRRQVNAATNAIIANLDDGNMITYLDIGPEFVAI
ncbi:MAG: GDSL family lipase, partial [Planctomycetales bacterium 12-60-4]